MSKNVLVSKKKNTERKTEILGLKKYGDKLYPVIGCQKQSDDEYAGLVFYCQYCRKNHYHGTGEGHRGAHCIKNTPFSKDGYILKLST